jgi:hypothetical protein
MLPNFYGHILFLDDPFLILLMILPTELVVLQNGALVHCRSSAVVLATRISLMTTMMTSAYMEGTQILMVVQNDFTGQNYYNKTSEKS